MRRLAAALAIVIIPSGLYLGVPTNYVSISWLGLSCLYFTLSMRLRSATLRWMAFLTMLLTVLHVCLADLGRLNSAYGIVSLLALGVALSAASLMYFRQG